MSWPMTCLGEVASLERKSLLPEEIETGTSYLGLEHIESGGRILGYQRVGAGELQSNKFMFDPGTLLYGKLRPYLAKICIPDREGCCSTDILPIRPSQELDISYLKHVLLWKPYVDKANSLCSGANLPRISPSSLLGIEIPLPPLEEQRRIAAILDKASRIAELCGTALKLSHAADKSLFLHFFADISEESDLLLEELADKRSNAIRTGPFGSQLLHGEFTDSGVAVLGIDNAVNNSFEWSKRRFISHEKYEQLKRYTVYPGDLLITIMGTCGRAAVVPDDIPQAINT